MATFSKNGGCGYALSGRHHPNLPDVAFRCALLACLDNHRASSLICCTEMRIIERRVAGCA